MQVALLLMLSHFFFWPAALDWHMNQQNVVVRGSVVDDAGRPVAGATVYAASPAFAATTVSDAKGQFIFLTLFPGTYSLAASRNDADVDVYGSSDYEPPALFAGYEYGATIVL